MSWMIGYASKDDLANDTRTEWSAKETDLSEDAQKQIAIARLAATNIIASNAVGDQYAKDFTIHMSGHANPNHESTVNSGPDTITVTVTQKT